MRRIVLLCVLALAFPGAALGETPPPGLDQTAASDHFLVHYSVTSGDPNASNADGAARLLQLLEQAYAAEVGQWGWPAPVDDGDGKTDVYVYRKPASSLGVTFPAGPFNARESASIGVDPSVVGEMGVVGHELFHVLQCAVDCYSWAAPWLIEPTANWAAIQLQPVRSVYVYTPWVSLDCMIGACGGGDPRGYARWPFYEFLSERFGRGVIKEIFVRAAPGVPSLDTLDAVLATHGTTLSQVFADFTLANLTGDYTLGPRGGPRATARVSIDTGTAAATLAPVSVTVDHVAAEYVEFKTAAGGSTACQNVTLKLGVTLPAGLPVQPYIAPPGATAALPLQVAGGVATLDAPWRICPTASQGYLSLPNASRLDGQTFTVESSLVLEPASSTPVSTDAAPTLALRPETTVSEGRLSLHLSSSGAGSVLVSNDALALHVMQPLGSGENTIAVRLPARIQPGTYEFTLTPYSRGGAAGTPLTYSWTLDPPASAPAGRVDPGAFVTRPAPRSAGKISARVVYRAGLATLLLTDSASAPGRLVVLSGPLQLKLSLVVKRGLNTFAVPLRHPRPGRYALTLLNGRSRVVLVVLVPPPG